MDKLKPIIAAVKKYHFWVICGAMFLTALVCWWLATSGLAGQYKKQESKINSDFSGVAGIQANHPNQGVIDEINKRHTALKKVVFDAWESLYSEQKEKNPFPTGVLGKDFKRQFENLRPQEELARRYRERYQNYIKGYFPKLLQAIDVRRPVEEKPREKAARVAGGMMPGGEMGGMPGAAAEVEWTGVIDWNENDYAKLLARFEWQQAPSTLAVVLAQEDLWVYEALLRVIKNSNEGATSQNNASVKRIEALEIGRDAVAAWQSTENALGLQGQQGGSGGGMGGMGGMGGGGPGGGMGGMGGEMGMGMGMGRGAAADGSSGEQVIRQLVEGRYIDDKGQPLPYQEQYPYAKQPYAEFRMMPIRMSLVMDQRKLPKFLVECANSNMPIEVRRIRLLKTQGPASGSGAMSGGGARYGMGGMGMGGAYPPPRGGPMGGGFAPGAGSPPQETGQFDMPVEIHAVIYIYNPPDKDKLGTGAASTAQPAGAANPAAPAGLPTPTPAAPPGR